MNLLDQIADTCQRHQSVGTRLMANGSAVVEMSVNTLYLNENMKYRRSEGMKRYV